MKGFKLTKDEFIEKSKKIHDKKYDYSLVNYINVKNKVKIICQKHGVFEQIPSSHLRGSGCSKCTGNNKKTVYIFIKNSKLIHKNKYDYSLVDYTNVKNKVKIICQKHGVFEQTPNKHLLGSGCQKCEWDNRKLSIDNFLNKSKEIHENKYDYSLINYINSHTKVKIICQKHGLFEQIPNSHLNGSGCPKCKESKGEKKIREYLTQNNIIFESQKKFEKCKNKFCLRFDFYIPTKNLCIEYNGKQHYKTNEHFGGEKSLIEVKRNDEIKKLFCEDNNVNFLIIKFNENVESKLKKYVI